MLRAFLTPIRTDTIPCKLSVILGHRRASRQRDPTAQTRHADAARSQGRIAVRSVRFGCRAVVAGPRMSGTQLAPTRDYVAGGYRTL